MSYIDGFVLAVPTANKQKFIAHGSMHSPEGGEMPFDMQRMVFGGFSRVVTLEK